MISSLKVLLLSPKKSMAKQYAITDYYAILNLHLFSFVFLVALPLDLSTKLIVIAALRIPASISKWGEIFIKNKDVISLMKCLM